MSSKNGQVEINQTRASGLETVEISW